MAPTLGLPGSGLLVGAVTLLLAALALTLLEETWDRDLNFVEA